MTDPETIRIYDSRAADYAALTDGHTAGSPVLRDFIAACPPGGRVLDLGCGPGTAAGLMAAAGLQVDALDASAEMVALARAHPGVSARQATFDEVTGTALYDGIWASFSLLHAPRSDMPRHLAALKEALTPGGLFHIGLKLAGARPAMPWAAFTPITPRTNWCSFFNRQDFPSAIAAMAQAPGWTAPPRPIFW